MLDLKLALDPTDAVLRCASVPAGLLALQRPAVEKSSGGCLVHFGFTVCERAASDRLLANALNPELTVRVEVHPSGVRPEGVLHLADVRPGVGEAHLFDDQLRTFFIG